MSRRRRPRSIDNRALRSMPLRVRNKKRRIAFSKGNPPFFLRCGRGDSNPHSRNDHQILSLARLPIPPLPLKRVRSKTPSPSGVRVIGTSPVGVKPKSAKSIPPHTRGVWRGSGASPRATRAACHGQKKGEVRSDRIQAPPLPIRRDLTLPRTQLAEASCVIS